MRTSFLNPGEAKYIGKPQEYIDFLLEYQLLDQNSWNHFIEAYKTNADDADSGWRGEYWGKMMRGACLVYWYTKNEKLYETLLSAVEGLLKAQDQMGRFSTYSVQDEFRGWDMWSRKYVLTGMQHFYDICRDEELKKRIIAALKRHADYIIEKIGPEEDGKINITQTSNFWLGVNSCSILEPILRLYEMTGEKRYLAFGEYIISIGGCSGGSLIDMAYSGEKMPYEYPEVKAYETMSFFEGVLCYAELTGKEYYFTAVRRFAEAVYQTDITVIGSAGCTHELFDHSGVMQTEYSETIMQETCVTVTWMRLLTRLFLDTGDFKYMERLERSAWNGMYGSLNLDMHQQFELSGEKWVAPLAFDSYSPLYNHRRGRGVGGYKVYPDGFYYGCCACIGAAGIALFPLTAVMRSENEIIVNHLIDGSIKTEIKNGEEISLTVSGNYPAGNICKIKISSECKETVNLKIRIPEGVRQYAITSKENNFRKENEFVTVTVSGQSDSEIQIDLDMPLREEKLNKKTAFLKGPILLARDEAKEVGKVDLTESVPLDRSAEGMVRENRIEPIGMEQIRITLSETGGRELLLTDYASCGKNWILEDARITAWMNIK